VTSIGDNASLNATKSIYIPNSVTSIGKNAFSAQFEEECKLTINCNLPSAPYTSESTFKHFNFNELIIGDDVTSIGDWAFWGCKIKSIKLGNSLTSIGVGAFTGCLGFTSVTFGNSLTSISNSAFQECSDLTSINIPGSVTSIGDGAFFGCWGLTSIKVATDNTVYDSRNNCNALIETATNTLIQGCNNTVIPNSVTSIGDVAFGGCSSLTNLDIPNSVTSIGDGAFSGCNGLTSIELPNSVTSIGDRAFQECSGLTNLDIPNSVTSIGDNAFSRCNGLTSIELPNSVTTIGAKAFADCRNLEHVILGNSVTSIGEEAFTGFYLMSLTVGMVTPIEIPRYAFDNRHYATLYVPFGSKAAYEAADYWSDFKRIIELANTTPVDTEKTITVEVIGSEDLSDNVIDGIYYNVGDDSYDATDGSIVIGQTTNMGQIINKKPGSVDMRDNFTGVVLDVAAGQGTIKVNAKTTGNAQLVVQIGNGTPMIATKTEQGDVVVSYDVEEDTYVYIYAIIGSSAARMNRAPSDAEVRIYGITVSPFTTGISGTKYGDTASGRSFTLDGKLLAKPKKGLNIIVMPDGSVRKLMVR